MLGCHHVISATIRFARNHRDHRYRGLAVGEKQLCPMFDHAAVFLTGPRQKAGHIHKCQDWNFKRVAEAHKPRRLARAVNVQAPCQHDRLVGNHPHGAAFDANKAGQDILCIVFLNLIKIALIGKFMDQLFHIIGGVGIRRHQSIQRWLDPVGSIKKRADGRFIAVVSGQKIDQPPHFSQRLYVIFKGRISDRRFPGVG